MNSIPQNIHKEKYMYKLRKTTITPNYFTKNWSLKKGPSNKPKQSNHNGENMNTKTTSNARRHFYGQEMAGGQGFEPWLPESESRVLPLNYPPPMVDTLMKNRRAVNWDCGGRFVTPQVP